MTIMQHATTIALTMAFAAAGSAPRAGENDEPATLPSVQIEVDPMLLRALASPDAEFIKVLHDQSERSLLANLGMIADQAPMPTRFRKKRLVFHQAYELAGERRHLFVYDPVLRSWPGGVQPQTIIICDPSYMPLAWKEDGGSPIFESAALDSSGDDAPLLLITRRHRHRFHHPERGIYRFSLRGDVITAIPDIEWLYESEAEKARYAAWRAAFQNE